MKRVDNSLLRCGAGSSWVKTRPNPPIAPTMEASSSNFNLMVTAPVRPFSVCYVAGGVRVTDVGPVVPAVDLVLDEDDVVWRIVGANLMMRARNKKKKTDLWCLGLADGGVNKKTPIVLGGKQLEENFVQLDLESNRLGFNSLLTSRSLSCADFNVTDFARH